MLSSADSCQSKEKKKKRGEGGGIREEQEERIATQTQTLTDEDDDNDRNGKIEEANKVFCLYLYFVDFIDGFSIAFRTPVTVDVEDQDLKKTLVNENGNAADSPG